METDFSMMRFQVIEKKLAQIFTLFRLKSFLFLISVLESTANVNWLRFLISIYNAAKEDISKLSISVIFYSTNRFA